MHISFTISLVLCLVQLHCVICSCGLKTASIGQLKEIYGQQPIQIVSSNETIIAIALKGYSTTTPRSLFENKRIILFTPNSDFYSVSDQRLKILESSFNTLLEIYNISTSAYADIKPISILSAVRINSDCVFGSILVDYWSSNEGPIIITTDREMPKVLRLIRGNNKLGRYLQVEDLNVVRLAPLFFSYSNSLDQNQISCVTDYFNNFTTTCDSLIRLCREEVKGDSYRTSCYLNHDYCLFRSSKISLSNSSFEFNNFVKYLQSSYPQITLYTNETISSIGISNITLSYMNSEVYECSSSTCAFEPVKYEEIQGVYAIFFLCIYYIGLLLTFNTKSIKIRLAVPYLCPLFVIMRNIFQIMVFTANCTRLYNGIANAVVMYPVFLYFITVVRYFYLRNLFTIISKSDHFKFFKFLGKKWLGLVTSVTVPFIPLGASVLMILEKEVYLTSYLGYFRNAPLGAVIILCIVIGLIFLLLDMIGNRRKIKKKGIYYYFFFDDPFYIKIDLLLIFLLLVLTIITLLVYNNQFAIGVLTVLFSLTCYLILGGSAMIIEIYRKISKLLSSNRGNEPKGKRTLESRLEDVNLMKLLRKFAKKEFSIENVMLYEMLISLENKKSPSSGNDRSKSSMGASTDSLPTSNSRTSRTFSSSSLVNSADSFLTFEQAAQIEELYMRNYSKFEVNFPNSTKKAFYKWFEEKKQVCEQTPTANSIPYSELREILIFEVIKNVSDTFSRLEETAEYKKWLKLTELQKENELYDF
ncbi:predicted protein [Naegleria gruberi]|uniref:Predicted protein n=1 Tax=Naegleria gruberi TaxID=5762 RepID=D2VSM1_NAEGR|nr:uncharacterized protein NAEGRDRAFT_71988 [Naegleria gruberi]EFC40214.1 predicted protein [Naegleria gruberi]|eukprot:XP_002672958.1 predicted protein [Naegleria gruberi strain NEG-M]